MPSEPFGRGLGGGRVYDILHIVAPRKQAMTEFTRSMSPSGKTLLPIWSNDVAPQTEVVS